MSRLANVAAISASVLLTLCVCEAALRLFGWGPDAAANHARLLQFDATLGWTNAPSARVV